jgi:putative phosphonate catabolism associated alcohol dehydrogenase
MLSHPTPTTQAHAEAQVFLGGAEGFEPRSLPFPEHLAAGEVLVRIRLATICGSDLHTIAGRRATPLPAVLGHEAVGEVVAVGHGREAWQPGDRVTWSLVDSCGQCAACTDYGLPQKCEDLFKYGHARLSDASGLNGCYASHIVLRSGTHLCRVPDGLDDALVAPANCALATLVNVLEQVPASARRVLVQGAGLLGLYGLALLQERGVTELYCRDPDPDRLRAAAAFGAQTAPGELRNLDAVIEVSGAAAAVPEGVAALRPGGTYVWAGMVHPQTALSLTGEAIVRGCLQVVGVHNYAPRHLDAAVAFLARNHSRWDFASLVSPPLPLTELPRALEMAQSRRWARVSVRPA